MQIIGSVRGCLEWGTRPGGGPWMHVDHCLQLNRHIREHPAPQTGNQSKGAGRRGFAPDHQPVWCFLDQVSVITTAGFIFHRDEQKRERISKARIFFYFNGCVFPEAAVRLLWKRWFEGLEAERASECRG